MFTKDSSLVKITKIKNLGGNRFRLRLKASKIHRLCRPGQFFNIGFPDMSPYLPRPFSVYESYPETGELDFLIAYVGKGTKKLTECQTGSSLRLIGPLGNGFPLMPEKSHHIYIAGSIGLAPFIELFKELRRLNDASKHTLIYGCRNVEELVDRSFLDGLDWDVHYTTDDGSYGHKGYVTDVLNSFTPPKNSAYYSCGPTLMMKAVNKLVDQRKEPCWVSMEEHMACGIGICKGCVIHNENVRPPLKTICKTGPVFRGSDIFI